MRCGLALAVVAGALAAGCGGSPESEPPASAPPPGTTAPPPTETTPAAEPGPAPLPGLPRFTAGYEEWTRLNRRPIPPRPSGDAHLGTKNVYASKERRGSGRFPDGTILVKEAMRPGKEFVGLIAFMRKQRGADPAHHDWTFVEYTRERRDDRFVETASGAVCWTCHMGAEGTDYVWIYTLGLSR